MSANRHRPAGAAYGGRKGRVLASLASGAACLTLISSFAVTPVLAGAATAQPTTPAGISARSFSGQFIVQDERRPGELSRAVNLGTNQDYVRLEPTSLTVSCERIKQVLYRELGAPASWRGKVYLLLYSTRSPEETITVTCQQFKDGWQYRIDLPDVVDRARLVRLMTQVLLLEMANRNATGHSAELPLWLVEGLTRQLLASNEIELVLRPPRADVSGFNLTSSLVNARKSEPLKSVHAQLKHQPPLTFEELSWPKEESLSGEAGLVYNCYSHLFTVELLRLNDGRPCLRTMLAELPKNYNWQFAFLRGFGGHFKRPLDVEKWWALQLVQFTGRDASRAWALRESLEKLDQAVHCPVEVRTGSRELPLHSEVTLQIIIQQWDRVRQALTLQSKLRDLEWLRFHLAPELAGLVDNYHQTLANYLGKRDRTGSILPFTKKAALRRLTEETLGQLDALDAQRQAMRPRPTPVAAARDQSDLTR